MPATPACSPSPSRPSPPAQIYNCDKLRLLLVGCYLMQALGVVIVNWLPTLAGFALGSLLAKGYTAQQIALAGDSAGGGLALALMHRLRQLGEPVPSSVSLISPLTDLTLQGSTFGSRRKQDPMIRLGWLQQCAGWFKVNPKDEAFRPLEADWTDLPPVLIQVGDDEVLLADSTRLAARLKAHDVPCQLHIYEKRWHVFHLQAALLPSARQALADMAGFMVQHMAKVNA